MFKPGTVFIIGAGASYEFGMPLGSDLTLAIKQSLTVNRGEFRRRRLADDRMYDLLRVATGNNEDRLNEYLVACEQIHRGIEPLRSIDQFIDLHSDKSLIRQVGKLAIALHLLRAERSGRPGEPKNKLYVSDNNIYNELDLASAADTWIRVFGEILVEGLHADSPGKIGEEVTIITFNYDRCIEHYLQELLQKALLITPEAAADHVAAINIIHPYGKLGELPKRLHQAAPGTVPYGADTENTTDLFKVAAGLQTFSEEMSSKEDLGRMHLAIAEAKQIVFLGFGFAPQNVEVLSFEGGGGAKQVYATGKGLHELDKPEIRRRVSQICGWKSKVADSLIQIVPDTTAYQLMQALRMTLSATPPRRMGAKLGH